MEDAAPKVQGDKRKRNPDELAYQSFMRKATPEEIAKHKELKKLGRKAQTAFRAEWHTMQINNAKGTLSKESQEKQTHRNSRVYKNFWKMVDAEGGVMNKEFAIQVATNYAEACEKQGPPFVMWDPCRKCMCYLHGEEGIEDEFVTMRKMLLEGEVDMPQEMLLNALQHGEGVGLSADIPEIAKQQRGALTAGLGVEPLAPMPTTSLGVGTPTPSTTPITPVAPTPSATPIAPGVGPPTLAPGVGPPTPIQGAGLPTPDGPLAAASQLLAQAASSSLAPQELIFPMMLALANTPVKKENAEPPPNDPPSVEKPPKKPKAIRTAGELLFTESNFGGRKLDGMRSHAASIIKQTQDETNAWHWATDEVKRLEHALAEIQAVADASQQHVLTSCFRALQKEQKDCITFLESHKKEVSVASEKLAQPLSELVGMHKIKITPPTIKEKKTKKVAT